MSVPPVRIAFALLRSYGEVGAGATKFVAWIRAATPAEARLAAARYLRERSR